MYVYIQLCTYIHMYVCLNNWMAKRPKCCCFCLD